MANDVVAIDEVVAVVVVVVAFVLLIYATLLDAGLVLVILLSVSSVFPYSKCCHG